jgi:hypothetical protein
MQGAASALMQPFKDAFPGTDWDLIPLGMYVYGGAGVSSWGSLCGVPNACIAVLNLIGLHGALGSKVMGWVSETPIPTPALADLYYADDGYGPSDYTYPKKPIANEDVLARTASFSPLCHVAVSKFLYAAGISQSTVGPTGYGIRPDRCAKLVADAAAYTAELINDYALKNVIAPYTVSEETASCMTCHTGNSLEHGPAINGLMDCSECHTPGSYHVPNKLIIEDAWTEDGAGNPKDTFSGGDPIVVKVKFALLGAGTAYVKTVKSKVRGKCGRIMGCQKAETLAAGVHTWDWSGVVPSGCAGAAKVVMELKSFDYEGGSLVSDVRDVHGFTIA